MKYADLPKGNTVNSRSPDIIEQIKQINYTPNPDQDQTQNTDDDCVHVTSIEHKQEIINKHKVCVVDVYGTWCAPCVAIGPHFYELAKKYNASGMCALVKEDVDKHLSPSVTAVPAFVFYLNGVEVDTLTGANIKGVELKLNQLLDQ
jgi:thioredoxin 1